MMMERQVLWAGRSPYFADEGRLADKQPQKLRGIRLLGTYNPGEKRQDERRARRT